MKDIWRKWAGRYAAMSQREQLLIAAAAIVVVVFGLLTLWVDPATKRAAILRTQMASQEKDLATLQAQIGSLKSQLHDPDAANRKLLDELHAKLTGIDKEIGNLDEKLVPPQRMGGVLQTVLSHHRGLALLGLKSLAPEPLLATLAEKGGTTKPAAVVERENIYRHGLEIHVAGSYADLLAYVAELERAPQRLLWGGMVLKTMDYPRSELTLTVYTLSRERDWLAL
jgi:MSHA biogenesis protein MshJ